MEDAFAAMRRRIVELDKRRVWHPYTEMSAYRAEVDPLVVVRAEGSTVSEQELKQFTLDNGPAYAHPRRIHFVDALPLSGAAKIDRLEVTQELERLFGRELAKTPA